MAVANYESAYGHFPACATEDHLLSWRVLLLPFVDEQRLSGAIDHDAAWDSPGNSKLHTPIPHGLQCHHREDPSSPYTHIVAVRSVNSFWRDEETSYDDISDQPSETLVFAELDLPAINWMSPRDVTLDELLDILERDGKLPSLHPDGVLMSFADGSTQLIPHKRITPMFLCAIVSINGGESISHLDNNLGSDVR